MTALRTCTAFVLALALLPHAADLAAQTLYKNVMPDGSIVYSDQPLKNAKQSRALEVPPPPTAAQREAAQKRAEQEKRTRDELEARLGERRKAADEADARVAKARKDLEDAEAALARGRETQAGDMSASVGGGARPNENYFRRIAELERAVDNARRELEAAQKARTATR